MTRTDLRLALLLALSSCTGQNLVQAGFQVSNGAHLMTGVDAQKTTTLAGSCTLVPQTGHIECDGLVIRVGTQGVFAGIGWELIEPFAPTCAGTTQAPPKIGVFSFGTLVVSPGAVVDNPGETPDQPAVAIIADNIDIEGTLLARTAMWQGSFPDSATDPLLGISPGGWVAPGAQPGASGAGGATAGGAGGTGGPPGGKAVPPQFEPLCFGSMGGWVAMGTSSTGGVQSGIGGAGGSAILLAAATQIHIGSTGAVLSDGSGGQTATSGGDGGGSGGTVLLESPSVLLDSGSKVSAIGGAGSSGGGAGGGINPPGDGGPSSPGGGGGAAGFIRVRTTSCAGSWPGFVPAPTCLPL